jgi:hypothetical protein
MIYVWRGDLPLARALEEARLSVHGTGPQRQALGRWLGISPLAHVHSMRALG